jgi:hypothetical protein
MVCPEASVVLNPWVHPFAQKVDVSNFTIFPQTLELSEPSAPTPMDIERLTTNKRILIFDISTPFKGHLIRFFCCVQRFPFGPLFTEVLQVQFRPRATSYRSIASSEKVTKVTFGNRFAVQLLGPERWLCSF